MLNMKNNANMDEELECVDNFRAWKYQIMLILQENDLEGFIKEEVLELERGEANVKNKKDMIKAKGIINDSIKYDLSSISKEDSKLEIFLSPIQPIWRKKYQHEEDFEK